MVERTYRIKYEVAEVSSDGRQLGPSHSAYLDVDLDTGGEGWEFILKLFMYVESLLEQEIRDTDRLYEVI